MLKIAIITLRAMTIATTALVLEIVGTSVMVDMTLPLDARAGLLAPRDRMLLPDAHARLPLHRLKEMRSMTRAVLDYRAARGLHPHASEMTVPCRLEDFETKMIRRLVGALNA